MSLKELWLEFAVARDRREREHREAVTLAWQIAALSRTDQLPPLDRLLRSTRRQTPQEQLAVMRQLAAVHGLRMEFRPTPPRRGVHG